MTDSKSDAAAAEDSRPIARAVHFQSRHEIESRPAFDSSCLVTRENYAGLIGDYTLPEADRVACQLQRKHERCNQSHSNGFVARTKDEREGYIAGDCAAKYFGAKSEFARDRARAERQIDMDQLLARVAEAKTDSTIQQRIRGAAEQLQQLCSQTQAVLEQLPQGLVRKLRDMAISGRGDVLIDIGYEEPPDPELPGSKPTMRWQRTAVATVRAPKAADLEPLRILVNRLHLVRTAWKDLQTATHATHRKLREQLKALESLPYVETEVRDVCERWTEFRSRENLMPLVILVNYESGQRAVVRVAMGNASKAALRTAWQAARDQIAAVTEGRPIRVP